MWCLIFLKFAIHPKFNSTYMFNSLTWCFLWFTSHQKFLPFFAHRKIEFLPSCSLSKFRIAPFTPFPSFTPPFPPYVYFCLLLHKNICLLKNLSNMLVFKVFHTFILRHIITYWHDTIIFFNFPPHIRAMQVKCLRTHFLSIAYCLLF